MEGNAERQVRIRSSKDLPHHMSRGWRTAARRCRWRTRGAGGPRRRGALTSVAGDGGACSFFVPGRPHARVVCAREALCPRPARPANVARPPWPEEGAVVSLFYRLYGGGCCTTVRIGRARCRSRPRARLRRRPRYSYYASGRCSHGAGRRLTPLPIPLLCEILPIPCASAPPPRPVFRNRTSPGAPASAPPSPSAHPLSIHMH